MADATITFHIQHPTFRLDQRRHTRLWLQSCAHQDGQHIQALHYLFCTDAYMLDQNRQFLDHDYHTDILTFPSPSGKGIAGDILISVDRVRDNAKTLRVPPKEELLRVMAHGVLHLLGYEDHTESEKQRMRTKEDQWIGAWAQAL